MFESYCIEFFFVELFQFDCFDEVLLQGVEEIFEIQCQFDGGWCFLEVFEYESLLLFEWYIGLVVLCSLIIFEFFLQQFWWWLEVRVVVVMIICLLLFFDLYNCMMNYCCWFEVCQCIMIVVIEVFVFVVIEWFLSQQLFELQQFVVLVCEDGFGMLFFGGFNVCFFVFEYDDFVGDQEFFMDMFGFGVFGFVDLQCYFCGFDFEEVSCIFYEIGCYQYDNGMIFGDGDMV